MTKQYDSKNQIWFKQEDNTVKIGFTKSFLEGMDQCWHILPANLSKFRSKSPLLTVETNDSLISIMSPVSGNFMQYSDKAQNFPDKLTEDDVVVEIGMGAAARPPQVMDEAVRQDNNNWNNPPLGIQDLIRAEARAAQMQAVAGLDRGRIFAGPPEAAVDQMAVRPPGAVRPRGGRNF